MEEDKKGRQYMTAYEFYWGDTAERFHSMGILPERRRTPRRITEESILNWGRIILGDNVHISNLSFIQVIINENTGEVSYCKPFFRSRDKVKK